MPAEGMISIKFKPRGWLLAAFLATIGETSSFTRATSMTGIDRRTFLGAAGALAMSGELAGSAPASERLRLGVIGVRGRGTSWRPSSPSGTTARSSPSATSTTPRSGSRSRPSRRSPARRRGPRRTSASCSTTRRSTPIVNATPDHWHALVAVMACQAGKDVYTEKPASHNVVEGRRMVEAARKYKRVVQMGTQRRSMPHVIEATRFVRAGGIGKVGMARAWILQKRPADRPRQARRGPARGRLRHVARARPRPAVHEQPVPLQLALVLELGHRRARQQRHPRPRRRPMGPGRRRPLTVSSGGGQFVLTTTTRSPTPRSSPTSSPRPASSGSTGSTTSTRSKGSASASPSTATRDVLTIDEKGWKVEDGVEAGGKATEGLSAHLSNFVECVKSRAEPNADIEIGHLSTRLCHLGNIAHRVGRKLTFDAATESFPGDTEANALLSREYSLAIRDAVAGLILVSIPPEAVDTARNSGESGWLTGPVRSAGGFPVGCGTAHHPQIHATHADSGGGRCPPYGKAASTPTSPHEPSGFLSHRSRADSIPGPLRGCRPMGPEDDGASKALLPRKIVGSGEACQRGQFATANSVRTTHREQPIGDRASYVLGEWSQELGSFWKIPVACLLGTWERTGFVLERRIVGIRSWKPLHNSDHHVLSWIGNYGKIPPNRKIAPELRKCVRTPGN